VTGSSTLQCTSKGAGGKSHSAVAVSPSAQEPRGRAGRLFPRLLTVAALGVKSQMDSILSFILGTFLFNLNIYKHNQLAQ